MQLYLCHWCVSGVTGKPTRAGRTSLEQRCLYIYIMKVMLGGNLCQFQRLKDCLFVFFELKLLGHFVSNDLCVDSGGQIHSFINIPQKVRNRSVTLSGHFVGLGAAMVSSLAHYIWLHTYIIKYICQFCWRAPQKLLIYFPCGYITYMQFRES